MLLNSRYNLKSPSDQCRQKENKSKFQEVENHGNLPPGQNLSRISMSYSIDDRVLCYHGPKLYEAKVPLIVIICLNILSRF